MDFIRTVAAKFLSVILLGSLLPVLALLIIAAFNDKVRRFLLWIMVGLTAISLVTYISFAGVPSGEISSWRDALDHLQKTILSALPYLFLLILLGVTAFLFGPSGIQALKQRRKQKMRKRYLENLVEWAAPQLNQFASLEGRSISAEIPYLRVIGEAGSGKSLLLVALLADLAHQALEDETRPLPILIDLDQVGSGETDTSRLILKSQLPSHPANAERVIQDAVRNKQIALLIDSSVQTFAPAFTTVEDRQQTLENMVRIIEAIDPVRLVVMLPPGIVSGALERLAHEILILEAPDEKLAAKALRELGGEKAVPAAAELMNASSSWSSLAGQVLILSHLAKFYARFGRTPADARELFRKTLYLNSLGTEKVEHSLSALAYEMIRRGRWSLDADEATILMRPLSPADLENTRLLRTMELPKRIAFAHPLYLAYFSALAWEGGQPFQQEILANTENDPILASAVIFFNNIAGKSERLEGLVNNLANRPDPGGHCLAAQCLLALPADQRPLVLVKKVAIRLLMQIVEDKESARMFWLLMDTLQVESRVCVYEEGLPGIDLAQLEPVLEQVMDHTISDARAILWHGNLETARLAGEVFALVQPREMLNLLRNAYERGPAARHDLIIGLLGILPEEAAGPYLNEILLTQKDPQKRIAILRSMAAAGVEMVMILLNILADAQEVDAVRLFAVQTLAGSMSPELKSSNVIREIVRISRMPLPERVHISLIELLNQLRGGGSTGQVNHWENMINPYMPGRPLTERGLFFGREKIMHTLRSALENGTSMVLSGEPQIGKTTILRQFQLNLREENTSQHIPLRSAYVDLEGLQAHEFFETVIRAAIEGANDPLLSANTQVPRPYNDAQFESDLKDLIAYLKERLGAEMRLALLFDGADTFLGYPQFIHTGMRRILSSPSARYISVVLTGKNLLEGWQQAEPPFYNTFQTRSVGQLTREDTIRLITQPVAGAYLYEEEALEMIMHYSQGKPGVVHTLCSKLIDKLLDSGERTITAQHVRNILKGEDRVRADLLTDSGHLLEKMLDWLETHPEANQEQVDSCLKKTWEAVGKVMLHSARQLRKN